MNIKITKILLFALVFGWMSYLQIQLMDKQAESENSTFLISQKRNLATSSQTIDKKLNDFDKKLNDLIKKINNIQLEISEQKKTITNINNLNKDQQKKLTNNINKQDQMFKKITDDFTKQFEKIEKNNGQITFFEKVYSPFWSWRITPTNKQQLTHPKSTKLIVTEKSLVTLMLNAHIFVEGGQQVQVMFFIDNKPVAETVDHPDYYNNNAWVPVNFSSEIILEPSIYNVEIGIRCNSCSSQPVYLHGVGYSIKMQKIS